MSAGNRIKSTPHAPLKSHLIWVLDQDHSWAVELPHVLNLESPSALRHFGDLSAFLSALGCLERSDAEFPAAIISESWLSDRAFASWVRDPVCATLPPVLIVSRRCTSEEIHACLDAGAADYLVKPAELTLIAVKLQRILRTPSLFQPSRLRGHDTGAGLQLNPVLLTATNQAGKTVKFTQKEFQILSSLCARYPHGTDREALYKMTWPTTVVGLKTLDAHLFHVRRKLEPLGYEVRFGADRLYVLVSPAGVEETTPGD